MKEKKIKISRVGDTLKLEVEIKTSKDVEIIKDNNKILEGKLGNLEIPIIVGTSHDFRNVRVKDYGDGFLVTTSRGCYDIKIKED